MGLVDRLTKSAHFLAMRETLQMEKLAKLYIDEVVSRQEVPLSIVSDRIVVSLPTFGTDYKRHEAQFEYDLSSANRRAK